MVVGTGADDDDGAGCEEVVVVVWGCVEGAGAGVVLGTLGVFDVVGVEGTGFWVGDEGWTETVGEPDGVGWEAGPEGDAVGEPTDADGLAGISDVRLS